MKRILSLLLTCALGLSLLSGCARANAKELTAEPVKLTDAEQMKYGADASTAHAALADFGLELLQKTREKEQGAVLISPLSAALALAMTANGAGGDTLAQFEEVLGGGSSCEAINVACRGLLKVYQNLTGSTQCSIANSLWLDPEGQIRDDFVGKCRGIYDAQVFQAKLSAPAIVTDLNQWVSGHTNKLIPKIIDQPFGEDAACLLVNALYLKNRWKTEFSPNATRGMDFCHGDGSTSRTDFLCHSSTELSYLQGGGAQGAVLPYDDGRLAFFALMPDLYPDSPSLGDWLNRLKGDALVRLIDSREDAQFLQFAMPKFDSQWRGSLIDALSALGLEDAFAPGTADFSNLGDSPDGYYISKVVHAARIQVNEKGTEAAAATVVAASGGGAPPEEGVTLILDRPFLYGIVDLQTGVPLFLGTYE